MVLWVVPQRMTVTQSDQIGYKTKPSIFSLYGKNH